jgi:hypothetical protein
MKNSYTQHIKTQMQTTKQQVISLLRWSEDQYASFQYKMGKQYLQSYISKDPAGIDMLVGSRIFWNWWKNQWMLRDIEFIQIGATTEYFDKAGDGIYRLIHSPEKLIGTIYPSAVILEDSYAEMIGNVIKSEI